MLNAETLAKNFRALSHPSRAKIFHLLSQHPEAGDSLDTLQRALDLPQSTLVHHLREMETCGLIVRRRQGGHVTYALTAAEFLASLLAVLQLGETRTADVHKHPRAA